MSYYAVVLLVVLTSQWTDEAHLSQREIVKLFRFLETITKDEVAKVMMKVDRKPFYTKAPYEDLPQDIGFGATFSPPQAHAVALETLCGYLKKGSRVLDVGCGLAYSTVCLSLMVGSRGYVVAIDHIPEILQKAKDIVNQTYPTLMRNGRIRFVLGDGRFGVKKYAPYDVIHIGAAVEHERIPKPLLNQLKNGGRLITPSDYILCGLNRHHLLIVDKDMNGTVTKRIDKDIMVENQVESLTTARRQTHFFTDY